jgi:hypothetical protein
MTQHTDSAQWFLFIKGVNGTATIPQDSREAAVENKRLIALTTPQAITRVICVPGHGE